jgi:hypothetical protein
MEYFFDKTSYLKPFDSFSSQIMFNDNGPLILELKQVNNSIFYNYQKSFFIIIINISNFAEPLE